MESQRVKLLTDGYLRGWLTFEYPQRHSYFREELILNHIEEARMCELLEYRLAIETNLRAGFQSKNLEPVYDLKNTLMGLKLPSLKIQDKIKDNKIADLEITPENIKLWKENIAAAKKRKNESK